MQPLPQLRAADLGGRRILHEVIERHAAIAAEPGLEVLHADPDAAAHALLGDRSLGHGEQIPRRDLRILAPHRELVRALHDLIECLARDRREPGMRDPGAVVPRARLAQLVGTHALHGARIGLRVVPDRNLRRHATHGVRTAPVAGPDQEVHVRLEEVTLHGHGGAVRQQEVAPVTELLDEAEDVVPAAAVQPGGVLAQLVEDLVHLERRENGLDEHRRLDGAAGHAERVLRGDEHLVPQPCLEVTLDLRQVEVGTGAAPCQRLVVVGEKQREVEQRTGDGVAVDAHVLLRQVPATRTHDERRGAGGQAVDLGGRRILEADGAPHRIEEIHLAEDDVVPGG